MAAEPAYYEYIVVGCGGIGSAAVYWLSRRSSTGVLGLEQFNLGHHNGGSQDHSRIFRLCYDNEVYCELAKIAYEAWQVIERESGLQIFHKSGVLDIAPTAKHGQTIENYKTAMNKAGIRYEQWTGSQLRQRFPQFTVGDDVVVLHQEDSGLLDAALGNAVHIQLARAHGATILDNCQVTRTTPTEDGFTIVHTTKGTFRCRRLVVTAGAWINQVLGSVGVHLPVTVTQEQVTYFATPNIREFTKERFPAWSYIGEDAQFYGVPIHGNTGVKIGIDAGGPHVTTNTRTYVPDPVREQKSIKFLQETIPRSLGPVLYTKTCLYAMTPDRDFVIDSLAHRGIPQVIICCGAGHAYKFASVLGRILSDLAVDGKTTFNLSYFTMTRPSLTDPNFIPVFQRGTLQHKQAVTKAHL